MDLGINKGRGRGIRRPNSHQSLPWVDPGNSVKEWELTPRRKLLQIYWPTSRKERKKLHGNPTCSDIIFPPNKSASSNCLLICRCNAKHEHISCKRGTQQRVAHLILLCNKVWFVYLSFTDRCRSISPFYSFFFAFTCYDFVSTFACPILSPLFIRIIPTYNSHPTPNVGLGLIVHFPSLIPQATPSHKFPIPFP